MGMVTSCCGRRPKKSRLHSEHDLMSPKKKRHRRDISATYSANDFVMTLDQLNINQATEEELMTLPTISRNIARNIIQYRNHIGGFRKAEDLALVSGVGANKLALIRMEIYCGKYDPGSHSTPSSSRKSSHRLNALLKQSVEIKVDVNKATAIDLSKVSGIGTDLAQRIVDYRNEVGQYKFLTDVSKVPEIGTYYFEKIRHCLTIDDNESTCSTSTTMSIMEDFSSDSLPLLRDRERPNGTLPSGYGGSKKVHVTSATQTDNTSMPTPFATMPRRKGRMMLRRTPSQRIGRLRVASWNLQKLSLDKVKNPGVKEVICMTLLENGLSLIACQDIVDSTALDEVCAELNNPSLGPVKAWSGHRGNWTCITAYSDDRRNQSIGTCGYLWDTSQHVRLKHSYRLKPSSNQTISLAGGIPFLGRFAILHTEITILNVPFNTDDDHINHQHEDFLSIEALGRTIEQYFPDKESMIVASDHFPSHDLSDLSPLITCGLIHVSPKGQMPNGVDHSPELKHTNNLFFSNELQKCFRGSCGVIKEGLSHPLIPAGWTWGGLVTDHSIAWAELIFQL
ncbi:endonuclease/exonuclease/phosphatase family domain-containing protein 1-like [Lytechinus variegatus]|uniref:endonuclease/exonuclease/phosphatase family domain-containing protein 1-like n=1 Tax=Lytechinus variegatus TaxID=7654 RepID=UPI001BB1305B|nr:endonuclease/exonuclease/phosphatase family domain-containing protein 1-like [Lytechinus variegatus]